MQIVRVNLGPRSYDVALTTGDSAGIGPFARAIAPRSVSALVVADQNLAGQAIVIGTRLFDHGFEVTQTVLPPGEQTKSLPFASTLYDRLADLPADRTTLIVAVGGGVIGDLAGFAAATYNRGLPLLMVPTSLLAMVDSSVGGKVGINHPKGKNLIGAFHQPAGVWIDTAFLATLPDREFRSGLAEVVKYGVILDAEFFEYLEAESSGILARNAERLERVVGRSCRLKADVVEQDEREETGQRAALNYGHTFAHAFETVGGYGLWLHGEAVAAGMICASRLAEQLDLIPPEVTNRQVKLLNAFGLPTAPVADWPVDDLIAVMRRDKKAQGGRMRFVLPTRLGEVATFTDVPESLVREVLR
jgi:3-dehydroquinate synthase